MWHSKTNTTIDFPNQLDGHNYVLNRYGEGSRGTATPALIGKTGSVTLSLDEHDRIQLDPED